MLPQASWKSTIDLLGQSFAASPIAAPIFAITYDRYGQGESVPKDQPSWKPEPHDMLSAATELSEIFHLIVAKYFPSTNPTPKIIFVSHSIGVPLVRLHNQHHQTKAHAHLFLDSNIANTDFVSVFPDPDAADFDSLHLPDDTKMEDLRIMRERTKGMFHPSVPNSEGLDRRSLRSLLPHAHQPKLLGPNGKSPFLTVIGHDPVAFAEEGLRLNGTPKGLNESYMQPTWDEYNKGLLELGNEQRTKGVVIANGAGHFIQRDNPGCVAEEVRELIEKVLDADVGDDGVERE